MHCYHIFSNSRGVYLTENHYEVYCPRVVTATKTIGQWITA